MVDSSAAEARLLEPHWNHGMVAASIAISVLGSFTSTQLMCQARMSAHFSAALIWTMLSSLTFGFCSIWCLHEMAMLACELDLPIGIDPGLTILSAVLAVVFTFGALASDRFRDREHRGRRRKRKARHHKRPSNHGERMARSRSRSLRRETSEPLLPSSDDPDVEEQALPLEPPAPVGLLQNLALALTRRSSEDVRRWTTSPARTPDSRRIDPAQPTLSLTMTRSADKVAHKHRRPCDLPTADNGCSESDPTDARGTSTDSVSRKASSGHDSSSSSFGHDHMLGTKAIKSRFSQPKNAFVMTAEIVYAGCTLANIGKAFIWSLAITSMHYVGIAGLEIPNGYFVLDPPLVLLSALISWLVCLVGSILMARMEIHLAQQLLFAVVATTGVAGMHWTGMCAVTFWSRAPPSDESGYPTSLIVAVASIAITTCIAANGLLAHSATVSRNKLAEIMWARRKMWRAIAEKENAESAAAARSEFIASASHEIRTPLHHLQGYSDLLSRTELTEEGRMLLYAIQRATKTLSLITNNVLDWSRLERDGETVARPVALDIRTVCESIIALLPNKDEDAEVELFVVVTPDVPHSVYLDETYIHRILMNLISNALKFTSSGYVLLLIEVKEDKLVCSVTDTGCGVPPSFLPQLFEPYKQAQIRGSQRGTGLGLSIIKQLLQRVNGTIEVESRYQEDVPMGQSGSTFTVTIPVQRSAASGTSTPPTNGFPSLPKIAIFHAGHDRSLHGLTRAWEEFRFDVVVAKDFSDLADVDWKYIWADLSYLKQHPAMLQRLLRRDGCLVLVPYDTQSHLDHVPGIVRSPHFVPIPKPLLWHAFQQSITEASQTSKAPSPNKGVRFAPTVDVVANDDEKGGHRTDHKAHTILLVEDNKINSKLGAKMLTSLGYQVIVAMDGQEAIDMIVQHDDVVDAILMDQSMPRKDGLTATREIRAMEAEGTLSRRRPIIAVTAVVSSQAQALCTLAGTDDFLAKPLSLGKLEQTLQAHLDPGSAGEAA